MSTPVVTVASGGLAVIDVTSTTPKLGLPVTEALRGTAVTKVAARGLPVTFVVDGGGVSAPSSDPGVTTINATGFDVTFTSPPTMDPVGAPKYVYAIRQGYDTSANPVTFTDTLILTQRIRQPYPNQASLDASRVAMSDYVYSTDTVTGVTNSSAETSPLPIANWALSDRRVVGNTVHLEIVAAHRDARNGEEVACVEFRATDGSLTVTQKVSASAKSSRVSDLNPVIVYQCDLDISTLATGVITVNAKVYPWVGGVASVLDSANSAVRREFSPRTYLKNVTLLNNPPYAYVDAAGVDATGVVSTTLATAKATPFLTYVGAIAGLKAAVGITGGFMDGCKVVIGSGTFVLGAVPASGSPQTNAELTITRDPAVARASSIVTFGLAVFTTRALWLRFNDITIARTGTNGIVLNAATGANHIVLDDVTFDNASNNAVLCGSSGAGVFVEGLAALNMSQLTLSAGGHEVRLFRGASLTSTTATVEAWVVLGCVLTSAAGLANASATRTQSGTIIAFNKFMKVTTDLFEIGLTVSATGGCAVLQNLFEYISATANVQIGFARDSATGGLTHTVIHHNTFIGYFNNGRGNFFYDEGATPRTCKLQSMRGNIHAQMNTKGDWFVTDGSRVGNWGYLYGAGCFGELTQFLQADSLPAPSSYSQAYPGLNASVGTSISVRNDPLFTSYQGTTSGPTVGAGNGDYTVSSSSPCKGRLKNPCLRWDLAGTARSATTPTSGAYEAP